MLSACASATEVALAPLADSPACSAVPWPDTVAGQPPTETDPRDPSLAAWGSPAVIARCGVPALGPTTDDCVSVNGVDWVVRRLSDGTTATTYGREPAIEVLVPATHGIVPLLLPAFEEAAKALPATGRTCS